MTEKLFTGTLRIKSNKQTDLYYIQIHEIMKLSGLYDHTCISPIMRKLTFCMLRKQRHRLCINCKADQNLCFSCFDSSLSLFLNTKIHASSHTLWLYSLVCVRPGENPHRWFSRVEAHMSSSIFQRNLN